MTELNGKIAVITGGTGGLGRTVVKDFLKAGAIVITTYSSLSRSESFIRYTKKEFPDFEARGVDSTDEISTDRFFDDILKKFGTVHFLCNLVGGVSPKKNIEDITREEWTGMFRLNVDSAFWAMKKVLPVMKKNRFGRIINLTAMPAVSPEAQRGGYGVAKAALASLTRTAAEEVKKTDANITVNAIAPSIIVTEENKKWGNPEEIKKWVTPDEISRMIQYLVSEGSRSMNGQIIQMYGKVG